MYIKDNVFYTYAPDGRVYNRRLDR